MIKYLSYFNLFIGIILLALSKNNNDSLDFLSILPILLFNWLTLFHVLNKKLKFEKWHLYLGYICIFLSILLMLVNGVLLLQLFETKNLELTFIVLLILIRLVFNFSVIFQVISAIKLNRSLNTALSV